MSSTHRMRRPLLAAVAVVLYCWLAAAPADALAQRNWVGSLLGDRKFSTTANWDGGTLPANGDFVTFGAQVNVNGDLLNDLNGFSPGRLTFTGGYGFVLKGNPLAISEALIINRDGGEHRIEANIGGKAETLVAANSRLHLSGANTFSGFVDVYGEIYVESNSALGSAANGTRINPGAQLRMTGRDLAEPIVVSAVDDDSGYSACGMRIDGGTNVLRDVSFSGHTCVTASQSEVNFPDGLKLATPQTELLIALGTIRVGGVSTGSGTLRPFGSTVVWNSYSEYEILVASFQDTENKSDISGSGTAGSLDFTGGGTIAPGSESGPGRLSVIGSFRVDHAKLSFGLKGTTAGTGHSAVQAGGPVTLGAETSLELPLFVGYTPAVGSQYRIIDNTGTLPISGTFQGLPEGAKFFRSGVPWSITYKGGTGNDVVVTALQPDLRPFKRFVLLVAAGN